MAYHIGHPFVGSVLSVAYLNIQASMVEWEILGDEQVWWTEKFWVMSITIYQTSQNCTHVHPGEGREEKLIERFSLRFSYCSYTFHHHYVNQRQYHFIWKVFTSCRQHLTVHCKHKREIDTSWHQCICFFSPDIKMHHNIFALSNKLWTVSCCVL